MSYLKIESYLVKSLTLHNAKPMTVIDFILELEQNHDVEASLTELLNHKILLHHAPHWWS